MNVLVGLVAMLTTDKNPGMHNIKGPPHSVADYFEDLENNYELQAGYQLKLMLPRPLSSLAYGLPPRAVVKEKISVFPSV